MPSPGHSPEVEGPVAVERRLQVGAALLLGLLVLIVVLLRAGVHSVFPVGWWRLW